MSEYYLKMNGKLLKFNDSLLTVTTGGSGGGTWDTDGYISTMTGTSSPSPFVATSDSEWHSGVAPWKAFNNDFSDQGTGWLSANTAPPHYIKIDVGAQIYIWKYAIAIYSSSAVGAPKTWTFQGSTDNSSWTTLDGQTNFTSWTNGAYVVFNLYPSPAVPPTAYRYYKVNITANASANYTEFTEMNIYQYLP